MILTDTHSHLYLDEFNDDLDGVIRNSFATEVKYIFLPNIDRVSIQKMLYIAEKYPAHCFPMIGLHPGSVDDNFEEELNIIEDWLTRRKFCAIGEIGIDLYWDNTFINQQKIAFRRQIELAIQYNLPIIVHQRNSFDEIFEILTHFSTLQLRCIFHCFSGGLEQADKIIEKGFKLGIGGVVTYKNSKLASVIEQIDLEDIVLETDSPYLAPEPFRGKRNEPAYLIYIAKKISEIKKVKIKDVADITTKNAMELFSM